MKKSFVRDYTEILSEKQDRVLERDKPVLVGSISNEQPLNVLERLVNMWPTHDVRYDGYGTCDDKLMVDMIKGAQIRTIRKDINQGIFEISVEMIKNLDEVERYNRAIQGHNRTWVNNGSQREVFDPVHGDSFEVRDNFIDPVMIQSTQYDLPSSAYNNTSYGPLANARPSLNRKSHLRVKYQMSITQDRTFILGYAAYDYAGQIIYYNECSHTNLAYLVRRSVQEIWGNPVALKALDNLLEGVSMLINGRKLPICEKDNKIPYFLAHESTKVKSTKAITKIELEEEINNQASNVTGHVMPVLIIIGFVICLFWTIGIMVADSLALNFSTGISGGGLESILYLFIEVLTKPPMVLCVLLLIGTVFFRKVAQDTDRRASELKARGRFI